MDALDTYQAEIEIAKQHLASFTDAEFEAQYSANKKQYKAVLRTLEWLTEAVTVLQSPVHLAMSSDVIDNANAVLSDFNSLLERMHMASYWKAEEQ